MSDTERTTRCVRDRRVRKTRKRVIDAFAKLARSRPYDEFTVTEVLEEADVGRSTFYEHYRGKDDLLLSAFAMFHRTMAECFEHELNGGDRDGRLEFVLEHFHENRVLFRNLTAGSAADVFRRGTERYARMLAGALEEGAAATALPIPHVAAMLAGAHFALIRAWLDQVPTENRATDVARTLRRINAAALA